MSRTAIPHEHVEHLQVLYSEDRKFVFIAVPKTGTTTIQRKLLSIDTNIERNRVRNGSGEMVRVHTHATAKEIRAIMGKRAEAFTFVAFLRHPRDVLVSKYHYYRSGRAAKRHGFSSWARSEGGRWRPAITLRVASARFLPFPIWARVYPVKQSSSFITDSSGALTVDKVGFLDRIQDDMNEIFGGLGYDLNELELGIENQTDYVHPVTGDPTLNAIVTRRFPKDLAIFEKLYAKRTTRVFRGK